MVTPLARSAGRKSVTVDPSSTSVGRCQEVVIVDNAKESILNLRSSGNSSIQKSNEMH